MRRRTKLRIVSGLAALTLAGLLGAELVAHYVLQLGDPVLMQTHPTIEYLAQPSQDVMVFGVRHRINAFGMRSDEPPAIVERADTPTLRVLVLGDSVINGGRRTNHNDLSTTNAQSILAERTGRPTWVGNASAGSWGPGNWLAYVDQYGTFNADAVAIVLAPHDISDTPTFNPEFAASLPTRRPSSAGIVAFTEAWSRYAPAVLRSDGNKPDPSDLSQPGPAVRAPDDPARIAGERDIATLLQRLSDAGVPTAMLYFPEADTDERHAGIEQRYRDLCDEADARFVDLSDVFLTDDPKTNPAYQDRMHPSAHGRDLLADAIAEAVLGLIADRQSKGVPSATAP